MILRIRYILVTVLVSQVTLFVYYTLENTAFTSVQWEKGKSFNSKIDQRSSNVGKPTILKISPTSFMDVIESDVDSAKKLLNKTPFTERYLQLIGMKGRVDSGTSQRTRHASHRQLTTRISSMSATEGTSKQPFQQIDDKSAWVYSAYFDHIASQHRGPMVRVIGIIRKDLFQNIYCIFSTGNRGILQLKGSIQDLPEAHGKKHKGSFVQCSLPTNVRPTHVSISFNRDKTATNRLQIIYPGTLIRNFTVCYSVLHSGFNSSSQLIQSLEMNRILGAEHFVVYNYSVSPAVDQILQRYQQEGLVTVLPWPLPTWEVHYYGQVAALNDCSYRNRNISRFVVVVDTDELIIPRNSLTWMELIDTVSPEEHDVSALMHPLGPSKNWLKATGSFEFRSSSFAVEGTPNWTALPSQSQFSEEEKNNILKYKIQTLTQFWRARKVLPRKHRTKYIARPELVNISGIHFVHSFLSNASCLDVRENFALVHHYHKFDFADTVMDTSILKFKDQLYPRLMQQYRRFSDLVW